MAQITEDTEINTYSKTPCGDNTDITTKGYNCRVQRGGNTDIIIVTGSLLISSSTDKQRLHTG